MSEGFSLTVFGLQIDATALSIVGGVIAWLFQHWRDQRKEKIQKTVELLLPFTTSDRLAEGNVLMAKLIAGGEKPSLGNDPEIDKKLIDLLDYYEFLCELLERKVLDQDTVLSLRGRLLGATFLVCGEFIDALRQRHGRGVYGAIEKVVKKHRLEPALQ